MYVELHNIYITYNNTDCLNDRFTYFYDSGSRGRGFEPHSDRRVVSLSKTYLPPKVLVIPRKRWLRPNMTETLFTGTLSIKPNQKHFYKSAQSRGTAYDGFSGHFL